MAGEEDDGCCSSRGATSRDPTIWLCLSSVAEPLITDSINRWVPGGAGLSPQLGAT